MKTAVASTSLAAYWSMRDAGELPDRERLVYFALALHGPMTREQIAARTGMKEGSACGRVNKLMERGIVVHHGYCMNQGTRKPNEIVELVAHHRALFPQAHLPTPPTLPTLDGSALRSVKS
ncbi:MAG TPA: helix-turn-helix domain-containing protein [Dongiaceae bacterium]|nr:helix-turn-helix domain-containing protein [Dongiaceae bacterium]